MSAASQPPDAPDRATAHEPDQLEQGQKQGQKQGQEQGQEKGQEKGQEQEQGNNSKVDRPKFGGQEVAQSVRGDNVVVKVGMVGDAGVGKTSLMVKYIEGKFDEDYIHTLGVNFMEKTITLRNTEVTFSIWDLGGELVP